MTLRAGVDIGTSGVKAALVDESGGIVIGRARLDWNDANDRTEIAPAAIEAAVLAAVRDAASRAVGTITSIGVASFAESAVLLDEGDEPLAPVVAWHDPRGELEAAGLAQRVPHFAQLTGLPVSALCTAVKVRTLADDGLDVGRVRTVLSVADWVVFRLTGTRGFDLSLASRTGLLDVTGRDWASELVTWAGLNATSLPPLLDPGTIRGTVVTGPLAGAMAFVAGMDHQVAALGAGATAPGSTWNSCGTAEAILTATDSLPPEQITGIVASGLTVGWHAVPGRQVLLGAQRSGYDYARVLHVLGVDDDEALRLLEAGEAPVTRLPVWEALVEHVASSADGLFALVDAAAGTTGETVVGGGWARSRVVRAAKMRHRSRVRFCDLEEPGAYGAACWRDLAGRS